MKKTYLILMTAGILIMLFGCSSGKSIPVSAPTLGGDFELPVAVDNETNSNRTLLGTWNVVFDVENMSAVVTPNRFLNAHFNVISYIPAPTFQVVTYFPYEEIIRGYVSITNPYPIDVYDVRLIIFTDDVGHTLKYPSAWTPLHDIPGGLNINPYRNFGSTSNQYLFEGLSTKDKMIYFRIPDGNTEVTIAIDASMPENCTEPYYIGGFHQGLLTEEPGSSTDIDIKVCDWQDDVSSVELYCPEITGVTLEPLSEMGTDIWGLELINATGAPAGHYTAWFMAHSPDSGSLATYQQETITIYPDANIPWDPQLVSSYKKLFGETRYVVKDGDYAYIGEMDTETFPLNDISTLKIFDISGPTDAVFISELDMAGVMELAKQGDYIYVADYSYFKIVDVSDPFNPVCVSDKYIASQGVYAIAVNGDYAYISAGIFTVKVFNVSDPTAPEWVADIYASAGDLVIQGNYLYSGVGNGPLKIIDITDPSNPEVLSTLYLDSSCFLAVKDNILCTGGNIWGWFNLVDVSDPTEPEHIGTLQIFVNGIDIKGNYAYAACVESGLNIIDISDPFNPVIVGNEPTEDAYQVGIYDNEAWVTDKMGGLKIINITDPTSPFTTATIDIFRGNAIQTYGNHAITISRFSSSIREYHVFDISDKENPVLVFVGEMYNSINDIKIQDDYLYMAHGNLLTVLDFHDPTNPVPLDSISCIYETGSVSIHNGYAYCRLRGVNEVFIVDISDPYNLNISGTIPLGIESSVFWDNYVMAKCYEDRLDIFDISDPMNPVPVGYVSIESPGYIGIKGDHVFVISSLISDCFVSIDISNPYQPEIVDSIYCSSSSYQIYGNFAYFSGWDMQVIDISDPSNLRKLCDIDSYPFIGGIAFAENYMYIMDGYTQMEPEFEGIGVFKLW